MADFNLPVYECPLRHIGGVLFLILETVRKNVKCAFKILKQRRKNAEARPCFQYIKKIEHMNFMLLDTVIHDITNRAGCGGSIDNIRRWIQGSIVPPLLK